jgi:hypothetical protein
MKVWLIAVMIVLALMALDVTVRIGWDRFSSGIGTLVDGQRYAEPLTKQPADIKNTSTDRRQTPEQPTQPLSGALPRWGDTASRQGNSDTGPQTAASPPLFDAETQTKLTTLVPIVHGGWFQGYRETTQYCRVLITDEFREVTTLGAALVVRYEPQQARPDFCAPGTLVLADTVTLMMIQMAQDTKEILRMMQRPR